MATRYLVVAFTTPTLDKRIADVLRDYELVARAVRSTPELTTSQRRALSGRLCDLAEADPRHGRPDRRRFFMAATGHPE
jgi:hypothetical protein